jgi:CheY-like chemotaxis protein
MAALLNAILDISRFDAGTVRPERSHFSLGPMLERLRHAHAGAAAHKGLRLRVVRSSAVAETDAVLLYRILSNLVANAVRYTERGGVVVGCRRHAQGVSIEVWDSGPGIDEAQQREVFREFVQLGNPQRDREQGLGLGLAIVERTARLLGHRLELRSRPGKGSMFALHVGYGDPAQVRVAAAPDAEPLKGCSVLVVEDQREVRAAMALLLAGWGCVVHVAESGPDARDQIARLGEAPDIVIADYRMPGEEDGVAVLNDIRRRFPGTGGILVSGDIGPEALRRAQDSGYTLLHKPLRPARLRALMGSLWRARVAPDPAAPAEAA